MMGTGSDFWGRLSQQIGTAQQPQQPAAGGYGSPLAAPAPGMQYDRLAADPRAQLLQAMLQRAQAGQPGMNTPGMNTPGVGGM